MTHSGHRLGGVYYANLAAVTPAAAAREMTLIAGLSRRVEKPVMQLIISLHPDESKHPDAGALTAAADRLARAAGRVVAKLGLSRHQAAYAVHLEKQHMHCHVCINRVGPDGKAWPTWKSGERIRAACRQVEIEMGYPPYRESTTRALRQRASTISDAVLPSEWTTRQVRAYEKSAAIPKSRSAEKMQRVLVVDRMRPITGAAIRKASSWDEAIESLSRIGYQFALYKDRSGRRRGLQVVASDGARVAASDIDSEFGLIKLERRWGRYDETLEERPRLQDTCNGPPNLTVPVPAEPQPPKRIRDAHTRLWGVYRRELMPAIEERDGLIAGTRALESAEVGRLRTESREQVRALSQLNISRSGRAFLKSRILQDCRDAIGLVRKKYREKREQVRNKYAVPTWIDFIIDKAVRLVQDAITVLSWLRRHLERPKENKLIASTGVRTPPEHFNHRGLTPIVIDTGAIEYQDHLKRIAFVDRGDEIVVSTTEDGRPEWAHMCSALYHADAKWGGCKSRGSFVFRDYALSVAREYRTYLAERFPSLRSVDTEDDIQHEDKSKPGVPCVEIPMTPISYYRSGRSRDRGQRSQ
jgi:hypothetical protein